VSARQRSSKATTADLQSPLAMSVGGLGAFDGFAIEVTELDAGQESGLAVLAWPAHSVGPHRCRARQWIWPLTTSPVAPAETNARFTHHAVPVRVATGASLVPTAADGAGHARTSSPAPPRLSLSVCTRYPN
jgi:hypothetical protein